MKYKILVIILSIFIISSCSFINENKIRESENIDVETFLEFQTNTWNIDTDENIILETIDESNEIKEEKVEEKIIIKHEKKVIDEVKIDTEKTEDTQSEEIILNEAEIEAQAIEDELKKLIDILFEVSN